ncbi:CPBP family glutamic-type intramembrane protease [Bacillus cereus]|uniref:CPBP family glutamic-type intramembrane protease n=1 Tax=Bacillus cereus TaxID=1396 RepID=UPI000B49A486|nr:CPBP family glutamic-type intramembrane protease [Bacillus cereus]
MNGSRSLYRLLNKLNYIPEPTRFPYQKSILYFLLIPSLIVTLNTGTYTPILLTLVCLLIGYKDIRIFLDIKRYKLRKLLKISLILLIINLLFSLLALKMLSLFNISDPQGIRGVIYTDKEYIDKLLHLPFIAVGEEFYKLLIFISFFILLSQFSGRTRIFIAIILASFMFGYMHVFSYKLTAGLPLMIGAIPTFYFMLYYRSILPLIIEHFLFDFFSFSLHTQYQEFLLIFLQGFFIIFCMWQVIKSSLKKKKPNTHQKI